MDIDFLLQRFINSVVYIQDFIDQKWGEGNILEQKNAGNIKSFDFNIKNSQIKGYAFHGSGCSFKFKEHIIDVEFINNILAFTCWSVKLYLAKYIPNIEDNLILNKLNCLSSNNLLYKWEDYFIVNKKILKRT